MSRKHPGNCQITLDFYADCSWVWQFGWSILKVNNPYYHTKSISIGLLFLCYCCTSLSPNYWQMSCLVQPGVKKLSTLSPKKNENNNKRLQGYSNFAQTFDSHLSKLFISFIQFLWEGDLTVKWYLEFHLQTIVRFYNRIISGTKDVKFFVRLFFWLP